MPNVRACGLPVNGTWAAACRLGAAESARQPVDVECTWFIASIASSECA